MCKYWEVSNNRYKIMKQKVFEADRDQFLCMLTCIVMYLLYINTYFSVFDKFIKISVYRNGVSIPTLNFEKKVKYIISI